METLKKFVLLSGCLLIIKPCKVSSENDTETAEALQTKISPCQNCPETNDVTTASILSPRRMQPAGRFGTTNRKWNIFESGIIYAVGAGAVLLVVLAIATTIFIKKRKVRITRRESTSFESVSKDEEVRNIGEIISITQTGDTLELEILRNNSVEQIVEAVYEIPDKPLKTADDTESYEEPNLPDLPGYQSVRRKATYVNLNWTLNEDPNGVYLLPDAPEVNPYVNTPTETWSNHSRDMV